MSQNVATLLYLTGMVLLSVLVLSVFAVPDDDQDVRHPFRDDIPDWW